VRRREKVQVLLGLMSSKTTMFGGNERLGAGVGMKFGKVGTQAKFQIKRGE
jgi:hypothetical protein